MDIVKYRGMFLSESAEHLQKMSGLLVALEAEPTDQKGISALFREAHSIKGMAATMGYEATARLAHHLEDSLDQCRSQGRIDSALIDYLLAGIDLLEGLLEDIRNEQPEREVESFIAGEKIAAIAELPPQALELTTAAEPLTAARVEQSEGLRIHLELEDDVASPGPRWLVLLQRLGALGEVLDAAPSEAEIMAGNQSRRLAVRLKTEMTPDEICQRLKNYREISRIDFPPEAAKSSAPQSPKRSAPVAATVRVSTDLLDHFINLTGELITNRYRLQSAAAEESWQDLNEGLGQLARLVKNLHHQVLQVRMMPLERVTGRLPRAVRELARSSGKEVQFKIFGDDLELDRAILEELTDPLTHMIRNAIDHGIEECGCVEVRAWREQDQVLIQVSDDGRGIDPEKIRRKALEKQLISPAQAQLIRDYDLFQLICSPGFSTAAGVTETSGRGVGMDVVKTAVERLGGVLQIDSTLGVGTRITMRLPLSVAIIRVLLIEAAGMTMALPITRVLQSVEVPPQEVQTSGKQLVISQQGELLPLLSLRKILGQPRGEPRNPISLVVTEALGRKVGLVVDRLVGQREVFVQSLPSPFDRLRGCGGGTILGDGHIIFLLDLPALLERRKGLGG